MSGAITENYSRDERILIENAVYGTMGEIQLGRHLIRSIIDKHFQMIEPPTLSRYETEQIGEILSAADSIISHALLDYATLVGDEGIDGYEYLKDRAEIFHRLIHPNAGAAG